MFFSGRVHVYCVRSPGFNLQCDDNNNKLLLLWLFLLAHWLTQGPQGRAKEFTEHAQAQLDYAVVYYRAVCYSNEDTWWSSVSATVTHQ